MDKLLRLATVLMLLHSVASAQTVVDVVRLQNGSIIRGNLIEVQPTGNVKIETRDGNLFVYPINEVSSISKDTIWPNNRNTVGESPVAQSRNNNYEPEPVQAIVKSTATKEKTFVKPYNLLLGLRWSPVSGTPELSLIANTGKFDRIEVDFGFSSESGISVVSLSGIYQWHTNIEKPFGVFFGAGPNVGLVSGYGTSLITGGMLQLGLDYKFPSLPIELSVDYRPGYIYFIEYSSGSFVLGDVAFGIRYAF